MKTQYLKLLERSWKVVSQGLITVLSLVVVIPLSFLLWKHFFLSVNFQRYNLVDFYQEPFVLIFILFLISIDIIVNFSIEKRILFIKLVFSIGAFLVLNFDYIFVAGKTPVHYSIFTNDKEQFRRELTKKNINKRDTLGNTPLHIAYLLERRWYIQHLIKRGADESLKNDQGALPEETRSKMSENKSQQR